MPRVPRRALTALLAAAVAATLFGVPARAQTADEQALEQAKAKVAEVAAQIDAAQSDERKAARRLAEAEERLRTLEAAVNQAAIALQRQEEAVRRSNERLAELERESNRIRQALEVRAADLYKNGSNVPLAMILASGDIEQAIERGAFLNAISSSDMVSLETVAASQVAVEAQRTRVDAELDRLARMRREQEEMLARVAALRRDRALKLADARAHVEDLEDHADDLKAEQAAIERLIEENRVTPASAAAPSTSGFAWPVCGPVTSEYGWRWGRMHEGLDVGVATGTPIVAANSGAVIFAGWQSGYGYMTLIDHGGLVTAYAHQSAIHVSAGQQVSRGQQIGAVGSTGNSTGPHLHFETRVSGSEAVDPRRYLPASC